MHLLRDALCAQWRLVEQLVKPQGVYHRLEPQNRTALSRRSVDVERVVGWLARRLARELVERNEPKDRPIARVGRRPVARLVLTQQHFVEELHALKGRA